MRYFVASLLVALTACIAFMSWQCHRINGMDDDLAKAQTQTVIAGLEASTARADVHFITKYVDRERVVREVIHDIQREAPKYVTPSTDAAFPLPVGFVRLHDAAAAAVLPGPPGATDAQASPVAASYAATVIAGNYGICHETSEQLNTLIDRLQAPPYSGTPSNE